MRKIKWLLIILVAAGFYFQYQTNNDFASTITGYVDSIQRMFSQASDTSKIYKVKDKNGQWHFSDQPSSDSTETIEPTDINPLTIYTNPQIAIDLIEKAKQLEGQLSARQSKIDEQLDRQ